MGSTSKIQRVREREDRSIRDTTYFVLWIMFLAYAVLTTLID